MRILHTADWHLGHTLLNQAREREHAAFLSFLLDCLEQEKVDVLLIAGDVFDTANPSAASQAMWYEFLADARQRRPELQTVVIAGNHDSAGRLEAPVALLRRYGVHVVGRLLRKDDLLLDTDRLIVELCGADGEVEAYCAAIPFLRPADLATHRLELEESDDPLIEGVRAVYAEVFEAIRQRRKPGQAILAMGHLYMTNTTLSELSERKVLGGNQHALPVDIFPDDVAYVALGHLHLPQAVGAEHIRYCGSPIPLSLSERTYPHGVEVFDVIGGNVENHRTLRIPRLIDMIRVPHEGALELSELLDRLNELPAREGGELYHELPYLEVAVELKKPEPAMQALIRAAIDPKIARLVKISLNFTGSRKALGEQEEPIELSDTEAVFRACYARHYDIDAHEGMLDKLLALFHEVHEEVGHGEGVEG